MRFRCCASRVGDVDGYACGCDSGGGGRRWLRRVALFCARFETTFKIYGALGAEGVAAAHDVRAMGVFGCVELA